MSAPTSRPVHPCVMSILNNGSRGAEYSTWAYLTTQPPQCPNLVTAQASTLTVYAMDEASGKLCKHLEFSNLAGNICYLAALPAAYDSNSNNNNTPTILEEEEGANDTTTASHGGIRSQSDSLLIGFCGHPKLTIVSLADKSQLSTSPTVLYATSLIDLTQPLIDHSFGSITPLEHDLVASTVIANSGDRGTVAVVLGGGVAVTCIDIYRSQNQGGWLASEPFMLPLRRLQGTVRLSQSSNRLSSSATASSGKAPAAASAQSASANVGAVSSIATGFGDIVSSTFLPGYSEPTVVLLHSSPDGHGRIFTGRLGRPHWQPGTSLSMVVTAISVTVAHKRSAVLWSIAVPVDAMSVHQIGTSGCLVVCANSLLSINNAGRIDDFLAVNGYARSTCPTRLLGQLKANPKPLPKLAIQLDGAALAFCSDQTAFLALRSGDLHLLQLTASSSTLRSNSNASNQRMKLSVFPVGRSLGSCGNVAHLIAWPLATLSGGLYDKVAGPEKEEAKKDKTSALSMGLLFAGSRLGDSYFLGYAFETAALTWQGDEKEGGKAIKLKGEGDSGSQDDSPGNQGLFDYNSLPCAVSPEIDEIMRMEEDALYSTTDDTPDASKQAPNVVPPSDDEETEMQSSVANRREPSLLSEVVVLRAVIPLDSIVGLGPLVAPCEGPISSRNLPPEGNSMINPSPVSVPGASALVFPCGYGSSGSLAVLTMPGQDDRSILAEVDCLGVESVFSLRKHGMALLGKAEAGIRMLRMQNEGEGASLIEVEPELLESSQDKTEHGWSVEELLSKATLLSCCDFVDGNFCIAISLPDDNTNNKKYGVVFLKQTSDSLDIDALFWVPSDGKGQIMSMTPMMFSSHSEGSTITLACAWSEGVASLLKIDKSGIVKECDLAGSDKDVQGDQMDLENEDGQSSKRIVAVDLFYAPANFFSASKTPAPEASSSASSMPRAGDSRIDELQILKDESDIYCLSNTTTTSASGGQSFTERVRMSEAEAWKPKALLLATCRQNGELDIFSVSSLLANEDASPMWTAKGCGHGVTSLLADVSSRVKSEDRLFDVFVNEIRFFWCGPSPEEANDNLPGPARPLCLAVETSNGDLLVYAADPRTTPEQNLKLTRVPLATVSRVSQEQGRFHAKLRRKRIVNPNATLKRGPDSHGNIPFQHNKLHRFQSLSEQDGLFAAVARPLWLLSERGKVVKVVHKSRHAAPAGGKAYPLSGFCSGLDEAGAFLTVHERVGRFGTQRLTLYREISSIFRTNGILPGGGFFFEKIKLGVTVRQIQFIDSSSVGTGGSCLYAVLVSRELEVDTSYLNDDGITSEEREKIEMEKESQKIKRQVEADLGGFDVEQEWVEEIEREDCFRVDKELGGAPPLEQTAYSLWIVDASKGWMVADSYELGENNHGMAMRVLTLTDFPEEPGNSNAEEIDSADMDSTMLIAVGVGVVDKNGEDVSAKGRILMFELRANSVVPSGLELSLVCEKDIFHGPVTSLSCLVSEGKNRLVIGAGADINVEQWGNGKLTQVGFFRATMQVLDIFVFKNFLLLSDAYDSLYFLVWRESDKSLTLLSKDYDPLVVYAAGSMSRGGAATFVCQDDRQNLQFFQYAPGEAAARGGNKLVLRSDFHLGSQTTAFRNHACRSSLWVNSASASSTLAALKQQDAFFGRSEDDQKLGIHFGTTDGGLGAIVPLSEPVYWRLAALQSVMANALESDCSLSQRAWRLYKRSHRRGGCRSTDRKKGVIDGDLIVRYVDLPLSDQEDLASAIGSTVDLILDNILELTCSTSVI